MENQSEETQKKDRRFLKGALTGALAVVVLIIVVGVVGYFVLLKGGTESNTSVLSSATETKLNLLRGIMNQYYLYDVNDEDLQTGIYEGYVSGLKDPYSIYYDKKAAKALMESTSGEYMGIGAVLQQDPVSKYGIVVKVYKDSPAEKAGLQAGDMIYQVDDQKTSDGDISEIVSWIKGDEGTQVVIHVYRGERQEKVDLTATRAKIQRETVEHEMKENQIGYIRVEEFDDVTYNQFSEALTDLENQGMEGLVIDLRANPGGSVEKTCDMLRLMLPKGKIVYTKDKNGKETDYDCDGEHEFTKPLSILVDGNSASASEIFTGAIQDYGIGTIVGTTTYGKGVVQSLLNLQDGTYFKLTTAEYFTPNGRNINKKGITPDVVVEWQQNDDNPNADNQLDKAMEVVQEQLNQAEESQ